MQALGSIGSLLPAAKYVPLIHIPREHKSIRKFTHDYRERRHGF